MINKLIQQSLVEQDGPDPLTDDDYAIIKGMVVGTGKVDITELGHLLKNNPTPLLITLAKICLARRGSPGVYPVALANYKDVDDFITHLRTTTQNRERLLKPSVKKFHELDSNFYVPSVGILSCVIIGVLWGIFPALAFIFSPMLGGSISFLKFIVFPDFVMQ